MTMHALSLRPLPKVEAEIRERLGAGLYLRLASSQASILSLNLAPADFANAPTTAMETACGLVWLDDAQAILSLLCECPTIVAESLTDSADSAWYWPLFNRYMVPELQALLSPLKLVCARPEPGFDCLMSVFDSQQKCSTTRLRLRTDALLQILNRGHWIPVITCGDLLDCTTRLPLLIGQCSLSIKQLKSLRQGDALLVDQEQFNARGQGYLDVGSCRLHLQQSSVDELNFTITEMEDVFMKEPVDQYASPNDDDDAQNEPIGDDTYSEDLSAQFPSPDRFDDLQLMLTLRAGTTELSLAQLRHLTVGSVLRFSGCALGEAALCHGEQVLAKGELVDIDGCLGLQITCMGGLQ